MVRGGFSHRQACGFPAEDFMAKKDFNDFRFSGLDWKKTSNKYMTMKRISDDESKIVVKVGSSHLLKTKYGNMIKANKVKWRFKQII